MLERNKYGDVYDTRLFFAGKKHKVVCAGDCYHVKNIKKQNALVYISLEEALVNGCRPCKHCRGKHKEETTIRPTKKDLVIIKCNASLSSKEYDDLHEALIEMRKSGILIIPDYCELISYPDDLRVGMVDVLKED